MSEHIFATTIQKTNEILIDLEKELNWIGQRKRAYTLMRSTLHALRDRLPVFEAVEFGAQLPLLLRGAYYDGWKPSRVPIKMHKDEFLAYIENQFQFDLEIPIEKAVEAVFAVLRMHTDPDELDKIGKILPKNFAEMFEAQHYGQVIA